MKTRRLGKTGYQVSEIGFGAWGIGADWGAVDDSESLAALHAAVDAGVTFIDTADVYGDGRSERLVGQLLRERSEPLVVATKFGRRVPLDLSLYTYDNFRSWIERSRENLGVETVDLVQLHCLPWETYYTPSVFDACDRLVDEGLVRAYGVSVEKVEEALKAIEYPGVATVQIIFNIFRQRPAELFFSAGGGARRGRDRARPARIRPADGEVRRTTRASPATTTGPTTATARASTSARPSREWTSRPGSRRWRSSVRSCPRRRRSRSSPCAGSSTSTPSRRRSLERRRRSRRARTPQRPSCRRCPPATHDAIADVYRRRIAPQVHQRW